MNKRTLILALFCGAMSGVSGAANDKLAKDFLSPPKEAQVWYYWWWLNGAASKEGITRDFEEMRKQGISGALLFDAGEAGKDVIRGPAFMSPEWRELYKHAVREADRCGIVLTVNLCSGWNAGGPWITPEHGAKKLVSSQAIVKGPAILSVTLPKPQAVQGFYRDIAVLASPAEESTFTGKWSASSQFQDYGPALAEDGDDTSRWISNGNKPGMGPTPEKPEFLQFKLDAPQAVGGIYIKAYPECGPKEVEVQCSDDGATFRPLKRETFKPLEEKAIFFPETKATIFRVSFLSAHPYRGGASWNVQVSHIELLSPKQKMPASAAWSSRAAIDVTSFLTVDGKLAWAAPAGTWKILRIGFTLHGNTIKCVGSGPTGLEIDTMSAEAMDAHFAETGAKLIADAGPLVGKTLQYFHIDSWELGQPTWTPKMREEFQKRRGYDPLAWLPAVLGMTVDTAAETARFMQDYRRTAADLVAENYYGRLEELSVKGGLRGTHPESGGPFFSHWIDALQCLGRTAIPMGEFWRRNYEPNGDVTHADNPSLKQAASAAHIYGKPLCQAEAFTSMAACDWTAEPWIFKDIGDKAFCEGLTRNVLCFWVHQPKLDAKPGFQWVHVGTHFDCNITWWPLADGWLTYLARCQLMLRQGLFVADFAYLQNEAVPSFLQKRHAQQPLRPAGFDYDVLNAEVLLTRATAKDGRLTLPDGMSYRYLVLPHEANAILSPSTLKKVNELAAAGVAVIGPQALATGVPNLRVGALTDVVSKDSLLPDIGFKTSVPGAKFDWIHRRDGETEIYFISNQSLLDIEVPVAFRVKGKVPELWDAVTGKVRALPAYKATEDGRMEVPMTFAPRQSFFIVFRTSQVPSPTSSSQNFSELKPVMDVTGAWEVTFDPKWFYPDNGTGSKVTFNELSDWTDHSDLRIKHYSGIATYQKTFDWPSSDLRPPTSVFLSLGTVKNVARVRLNGHDLGTVWTAPWQVEISSAVKPGANVLEIEVANLWPNRLIGDATLPQEQRRTVTNVRTYDTQETASYGCKKCGTRKKDGKPADLLPSGLLGPVRILVLKGE
jgi:hypothetical protein